MLASQPAKPTRLRYKKSHNKLCNLLFMCISRTMQFISPVYDQLSKSACHFHVEGPLPLDFGPICPDHRPGNELRGSCTAQILEGDHVVPWHPRQPSRPVNQKLAYLTSEMRNSATFQGKPEIGTLKYPTGCAISAAGR